MDEHNSFIKKVKIAYKQIERLKGTDRYLANVLKMPPTQDIESIEKLVIFIGSERSGSTICGSFLDAHPDIVISTEYNLVHQIKRGLSKAQLCRLMYFNARRFKKKGAKWTGYSYDVPALHQGTYKSLKIIGDKKANSSAYILSQNLQEIEDIEAVFQVPLKMVHMIRHPLDAISTIAQRSLHDLDRAMAFYFRTSQSVQAIMDHTPERIITLRHEDLCSDPVPTLKALTGFLNIDADDEYYQQCASIIKPPSKKSRERIDWPDDKIEAVREHIRSFDFLSSYDDF